MTEIELGPLRLTVERRSLGGAGGPSLSIYERDGGRQLLRFDCFDREAHWHADPDGRDEIRSIDAAEDPVAWTMAELRGDLPGYLARAGYEPPVPIERSEATPTLSRVEQAMRES